MRNIFLCLTVVACLAHTVAFAGKLRYPEAFDAENLHAEPLSGSNARHVYETFPELLQRPEVRGQPVDKLVEWAASAVSAMKKGQVPVTRSHAELPAVFLIPWVIRNGAGQIIAFLEPAFVLNHTFQIKEGVQLRGDAVSDLQRRVHMREPFRDMSRIFNTFEIVFKSPDAAENPAVLRLMTHHLIFPYIARDIAFSRLDPENQKPPTIIPAIYGGAVFIQPEHIVLESAPPADLTPAALKEYETRRLLQRHLVTLNPCAPEVCVEDGENRPTVPTTFYFIDQTSREHGLSSPVATTIQTPASGSNTPALEEPADSAPPPFSLEDEPNIAPPPTQPLIMSPPQRLTIQTPPKHRDRPAPSLGKPLPRSERLLTDEDLKLDTPPVSGSKRKPMRWRGRVGGTTSTTADYDRAIAFLTSLQVSPRIPDSLGEEGATNSETYVATSTTAPVNDVRGLGVFPITFDQRPHEDDATEKGGQLVLLPDEPSLSENEEADDSF